MTNTMRIKGCMAIHIVHIAWYMKVNEYIHGS